MDLHNLPQATFHSLLTGGWHLGDTATYFFFHPQQEGAKLSP